jgi:hypothetical protein
MNWIKNKDDLTRARIRYNIESWYKSWYMGTDEAMLIHLEEFDNVYDPERFDTDDFEEEKRKFLTELQEIVDKRLGNLGG